jgi:acyl-CoA reductase-like NAD-dependent aldehyde dehydrogenase
MATMKTLSPIDGSLVVERELSDWAAFDAILNRAVAAQKAWKARPLEERLAVCTKLVDVLEAHADEWAPELTRQMGRPIRFAPKEIRTAAARAKTMCDLAPEALADVPVAGQEPFKLFVKRDPLGVVLVVPAWNYPWMIAINSVVPALVAGNSVVLKHSAQVPLVAERLGEALKEAGLPSDVYQFVHASHADVEKAVADPRVDFVAFTGSVGGGHAMVKAAQDRFVNQGLELGGKDPAYVRGDADLDFAIENLVDGAFFNSGQSCCGIERIYVHRSVYDKFVEGAVALANKYKVGDPLDPETDLGPVAKTAHAAFVRAEIKKAVDAGAKAHLDESSFANVNEGTPYLAPQILTDVDHSMSVMMEETFGPVVGIMAVDSDEEAVSLMNDSPYGLTASVWTKDVDAALRIGEQVETGTWFMNRCDYLDPGLAWVGVKDSGRGCTLSKLGYEQLTRPKSYHLRTRT